LHLSHNQLTGSIPRSFKSDALEIRPIGKFFRSPFEKILLAQTKNFLVRCSRLSFSCV
jgi:hypothetical protein